MTVAAPGAICAEPHRWATLLGMSLGRPLRFAALVAFGTGLFVSAAQAEAPVVVVFEIEDERARSQRLSDEKTEALTDFLRSQLAAGGRFQVMPPGEVQQALRARKAESYKACYDEACQIEVGKELAAEKSLATKIARIGTSCLITSTLYDLARATTETSAPHRGACKDDDLLEGLERIASLLRGGGPAQTQGFARARVELGDLTPITEFKVDAGGVSFAGLDVNYFKLVQAAKRLEKDKGKAGATAEAWQKVAEYKGKNPLAAQARERATYWKKAEALRVRYTADKTKLDELLGLDNDVLGPAPKQAAQSEFQAAYAPYVQLLDRLGLTFPWARLSNGAFCPSAATIKREKKSAVEVRDKKRETIVTDIERCVRAGKTEGLELRTRSDGVRYEMTYRAGALDGRWLRYQDGQKLEEASYKDAKLHGIFKAWRSDGTLRTVCDRYIQGKLEGACKGLYPSGKTKRNSPYKAGKKQGLQEQWYDSGQLRRACPFVNGAVHGVCKSWREDGSLHEVSDFVAGKTEGQQVYYDKDGVRTSAYTTKAGQRQGPRTVWFKSGEIQAIYHYKAGKRDGPYERRARDGTKSESGLYRAGLREGPITTWHANGKKAGETMYRADKPDGAKITWRATGPKSMQAAYQEGKAEGVWRWWYSRGALTREIHYKAGQRDGLATVWRDNGKLREKGGYKVGKREGRWVWWGPLGNQTREAFYRDGLNDGFMRRWYDNGQIASERRYEAGKLEGVSKFWDPQGKVLGEVTFTNGTGEDRSWHSNGVLSLQGRRVEMNNEGTWRYYYRGGRPRLEEIYVDGKLQRSQSWYPNGQKQSTSEYKDGQLHGEQVHYGPGGKLVARARFQAGSGQVTRLNRWGVVVEQGLYEEGKRSGPWKFFDELGEPTSLVTYKANQREGESREYGPGGRTLSVKTYRRNTRHGPEIQYGAAGDKVLQGDYVDGLPDGSWLHYGPDGKLLDEQAFVAGSGLHRRYAQGIKVEESRIRRGGPDGVKMRWHPNGRPFSQEAYVLGQAHGPSRGFFSDGAKMWVGQSEHGRPVGVWTHWDRDGKELGRTDYEAEDRVEFDRAEDGSLLRESGRRAGVWHGPHRRRDKETGHLVVDDRFEDEHRLQTTRYEAETGSLAWKGFYDNNGNSIGQWEAFDGEGRATCRVDYATPCPTVARLDPAGEAISGFEAQPSAARATAIKRCRGWALDALAYCPK